MVNNSQKLAKLIEKGFNLINNNFKEYKEASSQEKFNDLEFLINFDKKIFSWEKRVIRILKTFNKRSYLNNFNRPENIKNSNNTYILGKSENKVQAQLRELNKILKELESNNLPIRSKEIVSLIEYTDNRELLLDGKKIHRFQSDSPSENLFSYLIKHPNEIIELKEIEKSAGREDISKGIHQKIRDLGFKGKLKKTFFPILDEQKIKFVNPITKDYLNRNHLS